MLRKNVQIIHPEKKNWNVLLWKKALKITELNPTLINSLKASKELDLFKLCILNPL